MNLNDYESMLKNLNVNCPVDEVLEKKVEFIYKYVQQHQQSTSTTEGQILHEIINKFKEVNYDDIILQVCKYGYTAVAIAFIGFQELKEEMILLEVNDRMREQKLCKFIIKNNTLLAVFDKNLLMDPKKINNIFFNNTLKVYTFDIYIHPYFEKKEDRLLLSKNLNDVDVSTPEEDVKREEERLQIENDIINKRNT
jgi:hypothetical protein